MRATSTRSSSAIRRILVVLDLMMPGEDGLAISPPVARRRRERDRS
jgi:CheY-like chemotaxis protein